MKISERSQCRLCNGPVKPVFQLADSPIANSFPAEPDEAAPRYPLELMQCCNCDHVQLRHVLYGLFTDYRYATPQTPHLADTAKQLRNDYPEVTQVLEIGSNNGRLLDALRAEGCWALGIDPAATDDVSIREPFCERTARNFRQQFRLIVANNVFAHIDDLQDVFRGLNLVLADDGAVVFEVQYLVDLINGGMFDMIYHEHLSYHTLAPLARFAWRMGFVMTQWEHLDTHGGSIRITVKRHGAEMQTPRESLDWTYLMNRMQNAKAKLQEVVKNNQPLVAFGASAKACTLINEFGLAPFISYCVDDTLGKQGRYIPGTDIEIRPVSALNGETILATAWNYIDIIKQRLPDNRVIHPFA